MVTEHQGEILQVSSLEDYDWPMDDPHAVPQYTRQATEADIGLVRRCLESAEVNLDAFLKDPKKKGLEQDEIVLALLSHQKFQMNPVGSVKSEPKWRECIQLAMSQNAPIDIVYPQFCVIPNAPKRYTNTGCAAGEDCTIEFFKLINRQIRELYPPGVRFHVLADAALYASAFQTHQTEVNAYYESVGKRIEALDASHCVRLYDYSELLRTKCHPDYLKSYYEIGHVVWAGNPARLVPGIDMTTLRRSVRCSVNTRRFQLKHKDHLCLFGPQELRNKKHQFYKGIETMTDLALREVITIRLACSAVDISTRLWPNAIRATCHKGPKNGRWAMGLRPYPEYYGSCKLLSYHGMPVITAHKNGKPKLEITPEVLLRGNMDLIRVTSDGNDEVYAYIAVDMDKQTVGNVEYEQFCGMRVGEDFPRAEQI